MLFLIGIELLIPFHSVLQLIGTTLTYLIVFFQLE